MEKIPKECKKCGSKNLVLLSIGIRKSLYCDDCLTYQKHLTEKTAKLFIELGGSYA